MDSNKDEALKCVGIAKVAIASGKKQRALKFIGMARRLNPNVSVEDLLAACENLESGSSDPDEIFRSFFGQTETFRTAHVYRTRGTGNQQREEGGTGNQQREEGGTGNQQREGGTGNQQREEGGTGNQQREEVGGTGPNVTVSANFMEEGGTGNQQYNVRRRQRRTGHHGFEDDFDPDEIFRSFFGQTEMFRTAHVYRTRGTGNQQREEVGGTGPNFMVLLQILPFLLIFLLAYLLFSEPEYSLQMNYSYQFPQVTHGVEFYVKSPEFDQNYPPGSPARRNIENSVIRDYKNLLGRYCHIELQRRQWNRNMPTPHCDKLQSFEQA